MIHILCYKNPVLKKYIFLFLSMGLPEGGTLLYFVWSQEEKNFSRNGYLWQMSHNFNA